MLASDIALVLSKNSEARVGISFQNLVTGATFHHNQDHVFHPASTYKVAVMAQVFRQLNVDHEILVHNRFPSVVDGSLFEVGIEDDSDPVLYEFMGQSISVLNLAERMITKSSNLATNLLTEWVGLNSIQSMLDENGIQDLKVVRYIMDGKAFDQGINNSISSRAMNLLLSAIYESRLASATACQKMIDIMKRQEHRQGIPALLPVGVEVANKTGWIDGIFHDTGIVFANNGPYALTVLTEGVPSKELAQDLVAQISRQVFDSVSDSS